MERPKPVTCPRCGAAFECKVGDAAAECQCAAVEISSELTASLYAEWGDCLCATCLRELAAAEAA